MFLGSWKIDDLLTFAANTHRADTGAASDADSPPAYRIYEDETTAPLLTGTMALLDGGNTVGLYSEQITLSAANGFEKGKSYTIYVEATVNSVMGTMHHGFQLEAEVDANTVSPLVVANVTQFGGVNGAFNAGRPEVNASHWAGAATATDDIALKATLAKGTDITGFNDLSAAAVNAEADQALADYDGPTYAELLNLVRLALRKDSALATDLASLLTTLNADLGSGGGTYANTTDATEAIRDNQGTAQTGDSFARLGAPAGASVSADIAGVKAKTDQLTFTTTNRVDSAVIDKTGFALSSAGNTAVRDAVTGDVIETQGNLTLQQALSVILAAVAGETDTGGLVFRSPDGVAVRITATVDGSNNRTAITLSPSA